MGASSTTPGVAQNNPTQSTPGSEVDKPTPSMSKIRKSLMQARVDFGVMEAQVENSKLGRSIGRKFGSLTGSLQKLRGGKLTHSEPKFQPRKSMRKFKHGVDPKVLQSSKDESGPEPKPLQPKPSLLDRFEKLRRMKLDFSQSNTDDKKKESNTEQGLLSPWEAHNALKNNKTYTKYEILIDDRVKAIVFQAQKNGPPNIHATRLKKGEFSGFPCIQHGRKYWWHPKGLIDIEFNRHYVCRDIVSNDFSHKNKYVVGKKAGGEFLETKGIEYLKCIPTKGTSWRKFGNTGYFPPGTVLFTKSTSMSSEYYKVIAVGKDDIVFITKNHKRNCLTSVGAEFVYTPKMMPWNKARRRMAQREFSSRRDSPVMVRLLEEIVRANQP